MSRHHLRRSLRVLISCLLLIVLSFSKQSSAYEVILQQAYFPSFLGTVGAHAYFYYEDSAGDFVLMGTDGTRQGSFQVATFLDDPSLVAIFQGKLYLSAEVSQSTGNELYACDADGCSLVKDINPGSANGAPSFAAVFKNRMFFSAHSVDSKAKATGAELWVSDGTAKGTQLFVDLVPGQGSAISRWWPPVAAGNYLYFVSAKFSPIGNHLWVSDGTPANTHVLNIRLDGDADPNFLMEYNGQLFSVLFQNLTLAYEPYLSKGTIATTKLLKNINPTSGKSSVFTAGTDLPQAVLGDYVLFAADDGVKGEELWVSDGTAQNTRLLVDANPGSGNGVNRSENIITVGNYAYMSLRDAGLDYNLYRTDGTPQGTELISEDTRSCGGAGVERLFCAKKSSGVHPVMHKVSGKIVTPYCEQAVTPSSPIAVGDRVLFGANLEEVLGPRMFFAADASSDSCGCSGGETQCELACADLNNDLLNCGACGNSCGSKPYCVQGECRTCIAGQEECGGACVDLSSSLQHCGACDNTCATDEVCSLGQCLSDCLPGQQECNSTCVDVSSDVEHCGGCNEACSDGEVCLAGACASSCSDETKECGGSCVDVASSPTHCGDCGNVCDDDEVCSDGKCSSSCADDLVACLGGCHDLDVSAQHCGACGNACAVDQTCVSGVCEGGSGATTSDGETTTGSAGSGTADEDGDAAQGGSGCALSGRASSGRSHGAPVAWLLLGVALVMARRARRGAWPS